VRKIRCDARPGGCSPCIQNNTECRTTDRITGRATSRGHTEHIENENAQLKMYMVELQAQLRQHGVDPKPMSQDYYASTTASQWSSQTQSSPTAWDSTHQSRSGSAVSASAQARSERQGNMASHLPDFRSGCIGDNYLGVSSENSWLSPIEGTSLALFGTKVDLAEFMPSEKDPASVAMSYSTFLGYAFGRNKPYVPPLPAYEQCKIYSEWYFRSVQNFIPILHKPDFMDLLERIHKKSHQPNAAETVMVHMVLAIINFQFSARNANEQARQDAMHHYHYSLSFVPELITGHQLEDVQALTMIASQLRNQPRPGAAWMFTSNVLSIAIELGLHRSAKAWPGPGLSSDAHFLEMRKRVFWSLLLFAVHLSGKLGRPIPLRLEDCDIEMPEPKPDLLPGESAETAWRRCSWSPALTGFKLLRIMMQVYASIYSVKSTGQYEATVRTLEKELETFHDDIPPELQGGPQTQDEDRVSALYIKISAAECQLLLHHPSLCRSSSQQVMANHLDICLEANTKMLAAAKTLKELKSLDTTWYYATDFLAAIFTTLFASNERRDQMTSADLQRLRQDMEEWLDIMGEVGSLLGKLGTEAAPSQPGSPAASTSGPRLQSAIRAIVDFSINNINRHIVAKTASAAVASAPSPPAQATTQQEYKPSTGSATHYANRADVVANSSSYPSRSHENGVAYPDNTPTTQYAYQQTQNNNIQPYNSYNTPPYAEDSKANLEAQLAAHNAPVSHPAQVPPSSNFMAAFQPAAVTGAYLHTDPHGQTQFGTVGPAAWRQFADDMMHNVNSQDYMHPANTMMALGPKDPAGQMSGATMAGPPITHDANHSWPLTHYGNPPSGQHQP